MVRILEKNLKKGYIKLIPEDTDDLWLLYNIIRKGDVVIAKTTRDVKTDSGSRRIPMTLSIKVTYLEFQPFTNRLRIRGIVVEGPEQFGVKGHYHTINLEPGNPIVVIKNQWPMFLIKKLEKASLRRGNILLVALDYDEYAVGILGNQGLNILFEKSSRLSGKDSPNQDLMMDRYIDEIVNTVLEYIDRYKVNAVIIAGPGFTKYDIKKRLEEKTSGNIKIYIDTTSVGGSSGLHELSRRDKIKEVMRELEVIRAQKIIEEFMKRLVQSPELVAYGLDEVEIAVKNNAVDKIVVAESIIRSGDENLMEKIDRILTEADKKRAEIVIAPYHSETEEQVLGLGGIIALLRFPIPGLRDIARKPGKG